MTIDLDRLSKQAPFTWFGGKSRAAHLIWPALGPDVKNYVEPFAGSLAVLLGRPGGAGHTETVNDKDAYLANFWRAIEEDPGGVATYADWPVSEPDLHARHQWLVDQEDFRERMLTDPSYFDPKIAGWWAWGINCWIGSGWCDTSKSRMGRQLPHLGNAGRGVHRKLPHLGDAGRGVHRKLPHLGDAGREDPVLEWFLELSQRLRRVRVACGDWRRVLTPSVTTGHGTTGILLDPPYPVGNMQYSVGDGSSISHDVRAWALEHGDDPKMRIALCGYDWCFEMPTTWRVVAWKARGGYASAAGHQENSRRERIWFSPHCLRET